MKITITIESERPWYAPFSSEDAYFNYHKTWDDRQSAREDKIDWIKALQEAGKYSPTFKNDFIGTANRNHFPNQ